MTGLVQKPAPIRGKLYRFSVSGYSMFWFKNQEMGPTETIPSGVVGIYLDHRMRQLGVRELVMVHVLVEDQVGWIGFWSKDWPSSYKRVEEEDER